MPRYNMRTAFTILELLVVIGVIGVLVGLLAPAVQQARAAAARLSCQSRMRQVALALYGHHDATGSFPAGANRYLQVSWRVPLLPYLEQEALARQTEAASAAERNPWKNPPHTALTTVLPVWACPADPYAGVVFAGGAGADGIPAAYTSYLAVDGDIDGNNGAIASGRRVRLADITDGASNTLLIGERPPSARRDSGWWYVDPPAYYIAGIRFAGFYSRSELLGVEMSGDHDCHPPDSYRAFVFGLGRLDNQCDRLHFWSLHTGGGNFALADGSVRFFPYSARSVLPALATRSGGEVVAIP